MTEDDHYQLDLIAKQVASLGRNAERLERRLLKLEELKAEVEVKTTLAERLNNQLNKLINKIKGRQ